MRLVLDSQKTGIEPRICVYEKQTPAGLQNTVSVSTKFATLPSSSTPRELNLVPARLEERRDIKVRAEGCLDTFRRRGADEGGMAIVFTNPRITDVSMRE